MLNEKYSEDELLDMPIVSQVSNPTKAMKPDALVQHVNMRLHTIGFSYETLNSLREENSERIAISRLLLHNTYANNVYNLCALRDEVGTAKFLCHESLSSNTTDDHYTCFSDEEAGERLHTIMSTVIPEMKIDPVKVNPSDVPNGSEIFVYTPKTNRYRVGNVGIFNLKPKEEIVISCAHGVKVNIITHGYNENGTFRDEQEAK